jgi:hypothetical protein
MIKLLAANVLKLTPYKCYKVEEPKAKTMNWDIFSIIFIKAFELKVEDPRIQPIIDLILEFVLRH